MQNYWNLLFLDQGVDWEDPEFVPFVDPLKLQLYTQQLSLKTTWKASRTGLPQLRI